jgi:lambda repressor-like predicted transcriptional regulator
MKREQTIKIRVLMMKRGISGAEIARQLGVTRVTVNEVINLRWKSSRVRQGIAEALCVAYEDIWGKAA